jgi:hypothetical protein
LRQPAEIAKLEIAKLSSECNVGASCIEIGKREIGKTNQDSINITCRAATGQEDFD